MAVLYHLFYDSGGKRQSKKVWLPKGAKDVRVNKAASRHGPKGYCTRITYTAKDKKQSKLVPVPKDAKKIIINPNWAMAEFQPKHH